MSENEFQAIFDQRNRRHLQDQLGSKPLDHQDVVDFVSAFAGDDPSATVYPAFGPETVVFSHTAPWQDEAVHTGDNILNFWVETAGEWWYLAYEPREGTRMYRWYMYDSVEKGTPEADLVEWRIDDEDYPSEQIADVRGDDG